MGDFSGVFLGTGTITDGSFQRQFRNNYLIVKPNYYYYFLNNYLIFLLMFKITISHLS